MRSYLMGQSRSYESQLLPCTSLFECQKAGFLLLLQRIVASYEEKQRELLLENKDLRASLEDLQKKHQEMSNQQASKLTCKMSLLTWIF